MLRVQNIKKSFDGHLVINDISFDVSCGEILGFLGPNGAGKTTTMRLITGALKPDNGYVTLCGADISAKPVIAKQNFGYLAEGAPLYEDMSPHEYLKFLAGVKKIPIDNHQNAIKKAIHYTMIDKVLHNKISVLSKGYKRRVALAGALLGDPPILILDEPTDGLDPNQKYYIRKLLKILSKEKAIIISTHILEEVEAICNQTITIDKGKIIAKAKPKELIRMSESYNAVHLIIDAKSHESCIQDIQFLQSVDHIVIRKKMHNWVKIIIFPKDKVNILEDISGIINKNKYSIAEMRCETGSLDKVFRGLTEGSKEIMLTEQETD